MRKIGIFISCFAAIVCSLAAYVNFDVGDNIMGFIQICMVIANLICLRFYFR